MNLSMVMKNHFLSEKVDSISFETNEKKNKKGIKK